MRAIRMFGGAAVLAFALTVTGRLSAQQASQTSAPKDATGQCTDGSYTTAKTQARGCLKHGGVKTWYGGAAAGSTGSTTSSTRSSDTSGSSSAAKTSSAKHTASASTGSKPKDATGECTDGSYTTAKTQARGCLKHGGVKTWYGGAAAVGGTSPSSDENAAAAAAPPPAASAAPTPAPAAAPAASHARATAPAAPAQAPTNPTDVWVNTSTKAYHCPGTKYYGTTKHGKYMSEADAKAAGFHPSYGKTCGS